MTSITNANSTVTRSYFNDNLLNTETNKYGDNLGRTVTYTYDADGRRASVTYPNNAYSFTYAYTGRGQLDYIKDTANIINFNYFRDGTVYQRALDNATNSFYGYDAVARVISITHNLVGDTRTFDYAYDFVGNRKWVQRDGANGDVYGYDLNDQSTAVKLDIANPATTAPGPQTIVYDASGNRKTFSPYGSTDAYAANALNQYTTRNGNSAAYDLNGNMTTGFDGSIYTNDAQNRLLSAKKGATTDTFLYDGLNRQIGKKIGSQALYYRVYDGWNLLGEYKTGTSNAFWAYLYANGGVVKNLVTNNYYYQDASGSTSHVANGSGALKEYYHYDLHGQPFFYDASGNQMSDTAIGVRHLFTGQQWYNEIGLYDLRNRYYSPDLGRFLQGDPIGFGGDAANLYSYCRNNPSKWSDPSGLTIWDSIRRFFAGIGPGTGTPTVSNGTYTPTGSHIPLSAGTDLHNPVNFPGSFSSTNGLGSPSGSWSGYNSGGGGRSGGTTPGGGVFYSGSQNNGSIPYDTYSYGNPYVDAEAGIGVTPAAPLGTPGTDSYTFMRLLATPGLSYREVPLTIFNIDPQRWAKYGGYTPQQRQSMNQFANFMDHTVGAYAVTGVAAMAGGGVLVGTQVANITSADVLGAGLMYSPQAVDFARGYASPGTPPSSSWMAAGQAARDISKLLGGP